jgi:hypothetical protein
MDLQTLTAYIVSSRCDVTGIVATITYTLQNGQGFSIGLPLVFNWRTEAHAKWASNCQSRVISVGISY